MADEINQNEPSVVAVEDSCSASATNCVTSSTGSENASGKPTSLPPKVPNPTSKSPKKKRDTSSRSTSKVWDHFTKKDVGDSKVSALCNYCSKDYPYDSKMDVATDLWNHLHHQCKKYPFSVEDKRLKTMCIESKSEVEEGDGDVDTLKAISYSAEACRKALIKMVLVDELPFRIVEGEGFKYYSQVLQPEFTVPSCTTVVRDCLKIFQEEKDKLKKALKNQRVCLTSDTWTSIQDLNYICLTARWIDNDWNLHKRILNFCIVHDHKGVTIGKAIERCLLDWDIERVFTITVENTSSNDTAIRYLKMVTGEWNKTILNNEFLHMRCGAHIVNLIVDEGLKDLDESIVKIRKVVRYVKSSPFRILTFKKCVEDTKITSKSYLCLDLPNRWNSTYLMLEIAQKFEKAFKRLVDEDPRFLSYFWDDDGDDDDGSEHGKGQGKGHTNSGPPNFDDWENVRNIVWFLKLFYNVTLKFSDSLHVTSNAFFHEMIGVQTKLQAMCKSGDVNMICMAESMKAKYDKYWGNVKNMNFLLYVAVVLDPRYKLRYVKFCLGQLYDVNMVKEMIRKVKEILVRLYEHFLEHDNSPIVEIPMDGQSLNMEDVIANEDDNRMILTSQFQKFLDSEDSVTSKSEVERYLSGSCESTRDPNFEILGWWKHNSQKFRILSHVARHVLAIPISIVATKSAFSTGGHVLDPFWSSLTPKTVEALICAQNWLRSSSIPIDLREIMDDIEKYEEIESEFFEPSS